MTTVIQAGNPQSETLKWLAIMGIAGGIFWYLFGKMQQNIVGAGFMSLDAWLKSLWGQSDEPHVPIYDTHGCDTTVGEWCPGLGGCIPIGLTCPAAADPYVPPSHLTCPEGQYESGGRCTYIPGFEPITEEPYIPGQTSDCEWPNGDPLSVPAGMNCNQAVDDMCWRFRFIPGYKGCP